MSLASGVGGGFSPAALQQLQQYLFNKTDGNGDGSVSQGELETAVTNAGGSTQAADALYSLLDPNGRLRRTAIRASVSQLGVERWGAGAAGRLPGAGLARGA